MTADNYLSESNMTSMDNLSYLNKMHCKLYKTYWHLWQWKVTYFLHFLYKGEIDSLYKRQCKITLLVFGSVPIIICAKIIYPIYKNLLFPLFFEFTDLVSFATKTLLSKNLKTCDDTNKKKRMKLKMTFQIHVQQMIHTTNHSWLSWK